MGEGKTVSCDFEGVENVPWSAPSKNSFAGFRKWDWSGLCPFHQTKTTGHGGETYHRWGVQDRFWGGVLWYVFPSPEFSTPFCSSPTSPNECIVSGLKQHFFYKWYLFRAYMGGGGRGRGATQAGHSGPQEFSLCALHPVIPGQLWGSKLRSHDNPVKDRSMKISVRNHKNMRDGSTMPLLEAQETHPPKSRNTKKRVYTNFLKKFMRTFAFFPVTRVRNTTEIDQKNLFR